MRAEHVDLEDPPPVRGALVPDRRAGCARDASVVDELVDRTELALAGFDHRRPALVGDVGLEQQAAEFVRHSLDLVTCARHDRDPHARAGELARDPGGDPTATAGDKCDATRELVGHGCAG
jgi:hypothetical protein